jgi:hypothetical protein
MRTVLVLAVVAACGGGGSGGGGGTGAIGQADAEELCSADCQRDIDCGTETNDLATCTQNCASEFVGWARADAVDEIFTCFAELACGENDDACAAGVEPLAIHEEWEAGCLSELAECIPPDEIQVACSASPIAGESDDAGFWRFIAPEIMEEVIACLDEAVCDDRLTCVEGVLELHNINF